MPTQLIRVIIIDDHPGIRRELKKLMVKAEDIQVVGEGEDGAEAIRLAYAVNPDVMLLDVELPILRGDEVARQIKASRPNLKVLVVSSYHDRYLVEEMFESGAVGYLTKDEAPKFLLEAVRSVAGSQKRWTSPQVSSAIYKTAD